MKKYSAKKFINSILFFAKNTDPKKLGIVKLNKLLYYIDFEHYKKYGRPILGDIYIKMEHGPVPSFSYNLFNMAFRDNDTDEISKKLRDNIEIKINKVKDFNIKSIYPKKDFDSSLFSISELEIMKKVAQKYYSQTGTALSKETHKEDAPWSKTPEMQQIDYNLILDEDSVSKDYVEYWEKQEKELESLFA
jgi:uncharacterized phage-associated protein